MIRASGLLAGMMLLDPAGAAAEAAERVSMVGTPVSLVQPEGFGEAGRIPGIVNAQGAQIRAFTMPAGYLFDQGMAGDSRLAPFLTLEGFVSAGAPEQREAGGKAVLVQGGKLPDGRHAWVAVFNDSPNAAVTFQGPASTPAPFDRKTVIGILDTVLLTPSEERSDGAAIRGLFLPLAAPFTHASVGGPVERATLSLTRENGRDRGKPHIDLFFPSDVPESLDLEELASMYLELDVTKGGSSELARLAGVPALRQAGTYYLGSRSGLGVGYVAMIGGQAVVLLARGPADAMTDEVVAAVDQSAAGLQRFIPEGTE